MIDPDACVYPMVGPGMGYKEMITGDYIVGRDPGPESSRKPFKIDRFFLRDKTESLKGQT